MINLEKGFVYYLKRIYYYEKIKFLKLILFNSFAYKKIIRYFYIDGL